MKIPHALAKATALYTSGKHAEAAALVAEAHAVLSPKPKRKSKPKPKTPEAD